ncbi:unnamed protein product [Moneuplotes crassus]|uniref:TAFII28-like protein domain-containing protein n=1 Tax=Euplotes crassus TaxID=5936 RepID=A0AAD1XT28_EUPCR|nr:unnamed protein product [Moneuplotes crassus]
MLLNNNSPGPKKRGRKKGSTNRPKQQDDFAIVSQQMVSGFDLMPTQSRVNIMDKDKKHEIYNQVNNEEKDRYEKCDKCKISEKHIKQIVNRVIGVDIHINKNMLKVIGGIAKVWVAQIVEEAKDIQVKEDYRNRELIGLNKMFKSKRQKISENDESDIELNDKSNDKNNEKPSPVKEIKPEKEEKPKNTEEKKEGKQKDGKNKDDKIPELKDTTREGENFEDVLKETLYFEEPLQPRHLKEARERYEQKRKDFNMRIL